MISEALAWAVDWAWGMQLVVLLTGGGLFLLFRSGFLPLKGFLQGFRLLTGKVKHETSTTEGQLTHFQALCTALAATIGMGNIAGVAVAITQGGAGAIFWMWVAGIVGMATKFFECTLSVMYRGKDYKGEVQGGPMYFITAALGPQFKFLSWFFGISGLIGTLTIFNMNQMSMFVEDSYGIPKLLVGVGVAAFTLYILWGGLTRIAHFTSRTVPVMSFVYIASCLVILAMQWELIPWALQSIFAEAFTGKAAFGGAVGVAFAEVLKIGIRRAAFSNEAGLGTASLAHGNAKTTEPVAEGLVAMVGPFIDTIIICTMTALTILIATKEIELGEVSGVLLTTQAFELSLPGFGTHILGLVIILFSFSTIIGYSNYGLKCWNFVFKGRFFMTDRAYMIFYASTLILGSLMTMNDAVNLIDTFLALMAYPTMIGTLLLSGRVMKATHEYFDKYKI